MDSEVAYRARNRAPSLRPAHHPSRHGCAHGWQHQRPIHHQDAVLGRLAAGPLPPLFCRSQGPIYPPGLWGRGRGAMGHASARLPRCHGLAVLCRPAVAAGPAARMGERRAGLAVPSRRLARRSCGPGPGSHPDVFSRPACRRRANDARWLVAGRPRLRSPARPPWTGLLPCLPLWRLVVRVGLSERRSSLAGRPAGFRDGTRTAGSRHETQRRLAAGPCLACGLDTVR